MCHDVTTYVEKLFIRSTKEENCTSSLVLSVHNNSDMVERAPNTHSLEHFPFPRAYDTIRLLTSFEYS